MRLRVGCIVVGFLSLVLSLAAQTASSGSASSQVSPLIRFSNVRHRRRWRYIRRLRSSSANTQCRLP